MIDEKKEIKENIVYGILKNNLKIISINKLPFIIGRKENSDLIINNPSISKRHALIQFEENEDEESTNINKGKEIILIDNSLNGTYVNGTKITNGKKILLETGDKISFGNDKNIYIFEIMNFDQDKTIIYPNMPSINKIETNPISLVNEDYYQKSEINHLNTIRTKHSDNNNNSNINENNKNIKDNEIKNINDENIQINNNIKKEEKIEEKILEKKENENINDIKKINTINNNNNYYNIEQIFSLKQEIFELKKENDNLQSEINYLKDKLEKTNNNLNNINSNILLNKYNDNSNQNKKTETNTSLNNSNINLLADDLRELGLFRRIKEALVPNYSELTFEELSFKFGNIIIEYKNKYNIAEILLNMENEFNNEISKFNNIISLQQEQKRDSLNKINYLFTKENNLEENNNYLKVNQYLMEQLNELINDKETNIKIINQLKGDIIKLKTEINLYKANYNKNKQINNLKKVKMINAKNNYINNNINENIEKNNLISQENQMKNYIDFNIDKYSIGYNKNKNIQNYMNDKGENDIYNVDEDKDFINPNNYNGNYINGNNFNNQKKKKTKGNLGLFDDYQRVSILAENSQDNSKYQEIIKQKELIVNGIK